MSARNFVPATGRCPSCGNCAAWQWGMCATCGFGTPVPRFGVSVKPRAGGVRDLSSVAEQADLGRSDLE